MLGFRLTPAFVNAEMVVRLMQADLLTVPAGENVVRLLPPLIIEQAQIDEAISTFEEVLQAIAAEAEPRQAAS
jgi:acetylornithine/succinyldiaminopimelate/putrescine aminotransferase